ncbi:MAG: hypothetical protein NT003_01135 [Candidatus Magasanikbacteria bacterium]|nr:hypothetical protein [Candidatus Magasanikbacteria bacterium]
MTAMLDQPKTTRQPRPNLKALAAEALASQPELLSVSAEIQAKEFLTTELKLKFGQQVESLLATGLLEINEQGEKGATGIDGNFYKLPTPEQVTAYFNSPERKAFIERKVGQGFTRLLITPFAAPLDSLTAKTAGLIKKHDADGKLFKQEGTALYVDDRIPFWVLHDLQNADRANHLVYNVTKFDQTDHGGKTKSDLLIDSTQPFPGFRIQLIQQELIIPREESGTAIKDRPSLEAGRSPNEYLAIIQDPTSPYYKEHGLTPEDWISLFSTTLHETNRVIDNPKDGINSATNLIGSYVHPVNVVPTTYWDSNFERACLNTNRPHRKNPIEGVRMAVG